MVKTAEQFKAKKRSHVDSSGEEGIVSLTTDTAAYRGTGSYEAPKKLKKSRGNEVYTR